MNDQQILLDYFTVRSPGLRVYRIDRHDSATVLWTSREALMAYLQKLQATHAANEKAGQRSSESDRHQGW